jgi:hypothetical protein
MLTLISDEGQNAFRERAWAFLDRKSKDNPFLQNFLGPVQPGPAVRSPRDFSKG